MRKLITYLFIAAGITSYTAQTSTNWVSIDPGYKLNYGPSRLIVKNNSIFVFNSGFSTLLKSTDGGASWVSLSIPSDAPNHEYNDLTFVNDQIGYVVGYDGSLFSQQGITSVIKKTTDGGQSWQTISNGLLQNSILTHVTFFNENRGIAFGTANMQTHRFVTEDGGMSWAYLPAFGPDMDQINSSSLVSGQDGFVAGIGHYMHLAITHDEGSTWNTRHFHGSSSINGLKFFNSQNGVVVANDSIFITYDGAISFFSKVKFPFAPVIKSFAMLDMQRGFFCTDHAIYYTDNGGQNWLTSYDNPDLQLVNISVEGNNVYATTAGTSVILKLDISELTVGIAEHSGSGSTLALYPNPAADKVYVSAGPEEKLESATIIDQLGRRVRIQYLADNRVIDVNGLSPGLYSVEILSGDYTYINKLIIQQK